MLKKDALKVIGSLSKPSKMPCMSYGLPAKECKTGSKLRNNLDSVCSGCYAMKGCYQWRVVQNAQYTRLESINSPLWTSAMIALLKDQKYFRFHDSGDIQDMKHLFKIMEVIRAIPTCKFWIPTKEIKIVKQYLKNGGVIPANLCLRISSPNIDQKGLKVSKDLNTSTVHVNMAVTKQETCQAPEQNGECKDCRKCWAKSVLNVSYKKH